MKYCRGAWVLVSVNMVPIDVDGSEQGRATRVMVDSSVGSAKAAREELPVPPAAMAAGDLAYVTPTKACRSLSSVMPTLLILSVLACVLFPLSVVLGTYLPFPLAIPFCC